MKRPVVKPATSPLPLIIALYFICHFIYCSEEDHSWLRCLINEHMEIEANICMGPFPTLGLA